MFPDKAAPPEMPIVIDQMALKDILGPPLFELEVSSKDDSALNQPATTERSAGWSTFLTFIVKPCGAGRVCEQQRRVRCTAAHHEVET